MVPADPNANEPRILVEAVRLFLEALKNGMRLLPASCGTSRRCYLEGTTVDRCCFNHQCSRIITQKRCFGPKSSRGCRRQSDQRGTFNTRAPWPRNGSSFGYPFVSLAHCGRFQSYAATRLLQVLIKNKTSCTIMIASTNHALDHLLGNVLDAGITKKVTRSGSPSADERTAA